MPIRVLTYEQTDRKEWKKLVGESRTGTWFQSPEAYDFFASLPEVLTPFVVGVEGQGKGAGCALRGVCVGYVTKEKNALRQFFTRRAIILGGPALADDATDEEVRTLMQAISYQPSAISRQTSAIYIETRNFNDYSQWKSAFEAAGFSYKPHLNFHVETQDFEARLSDNRRRQIRRGVKELRSEGVKEAVSEGDVKEWYAVLAELYRTKVKTPLFPLEFFLQAFRQGVGHFLPVKEQGRVIGGSMLVADERCVYEWYECGLNSRYKEQYPSVMATYRGIVYARTHGCVRYDMMGAGEPNVPYGVRDFKAEFGGTLVEHGRFLCVCKPLLYRLGSFGVKMMKRI